MDCDHSVLSSWYREESSPETLWAASAKNNNSGLGIVWNETEDKRASFLLTIKDEAGVCTILIFPSQKMLLGSGIEKDA